MLATRILTAAVLIPAVLAALFLLPPLAWGSSRSRSSRWRRTSGRGSSASRRRARIVFVGARSS